MKPSLVEWQKEGHAFKFGERRIFYKDEGEGVALLCLHGFPTASWDWHRIWPDLKKNYRVIAPDMLGFGFSDKPQNHHYSIIEQADMIEELLMHLKVDEVHLLAHDYGASVAQEIMARFHEHTTAQNLKIRTVCFLNGGLFPETHRPRFIQRLLLTPLGALLIPFMGRFRFTRSLSAVFAPSHKPKHSELETFWELFQRGGGKWILTRLIQYIPERTKNRERWVSALMPTSIPMRLINGAMDPVSGKHMAQRFMELIPKADVVSLEDCGHYPQYEQPQAMVRAYLSFLKRNTAHN